LLIEKICGTETDATLSFTGNQIEYKRYFNSLMGMPCTPRNDTTCIDPLPSGSYEIVQCIVDRNHLNADSIFLLDTIELVIN